MVSGVARIGTGNPAWHRRDRAVRVAARRVLATAAALLRARVPLPKLVSSQLRQSAAVVSRHHGSSVPKPVLNYLADMGKYGQASADGKSWVDVAKQAPYDGSGQTPGRGKTGSWYTTCSACRKWFYLCKLSTAVCQCGNRHPDSTLALAVEAGANIAGKANGKGPKNQARGDATSSKSPSPGKGGKGGKSECGEKKGGMDKQAEGDIRPNGRKVVWKVPPANSTVDNTNTVASSASGRPSPEQLCFWLESYKRDGTVTGGDDLTFVPGESEPPTAETRTKFEILRDTEAKTLQEANHKAVAMANLVSQHRRKLDKAFTAEGKAQQLVEDLETKLNAAKEAWKQSADRLNERRLKQQEMDKDLDVAQREAKSFNLSSEEVKEEVDSEPDANQELWGMAVDNIVEALSQHDSSISTDQSKATKVREICQGAIVGAKVRLARSRSPDTSRREAARSPAAPSGYDQDDRTGWDRELDFQEEASDLSDEDMETLDEEVTEVPVQLSARNKEIYKRIQKADRKARVSGVDGASASRKADNAARKVANDKLKSKPRVTVREEPHSDGDSEPEKEKAAG
jgi:hypothetical protein